MASGTSNPTNGQRHGLTPSGASLGIAETGAGQPPAFRFDVRRSLRMHPVLAGGVAVAVFLLLVVYALSRKPVYSAESLVYVEPLEVRVLSDGSSSGYDPSRYDSYLQQQVQTVERADTLEAALAKLPPGVWSAPGENAAAALQRLENAIKVERVLNSYQLAIDVKAGTAAAAAAAANAVTSAYLEEGRKDEHTRADQRLQLLTEERQRITGDMTEDKAEQGRLGTSLGVANPTGASGNPYDAQSEGLRTQLAAAREAHDTVAAQLASVSGANGNGLDTAANELIVSDPGLVSIRQTLSQRRAILSDQMAGLTPANPVYRQDQEEMAALDRSMDRATAEARERAERQLQDKLRLDLRRTADTEGRLNAQLAEQTARATGAGPKLQRAAELDTDLQRLSARYAAVDDAIRGLQLETSGPAQAHLALAARVPDAPEPNRSKLILLLALPLSLLCGLAAAVIARKRDPRIYLGADLQDVLGFPPMCVLPSASEVSGVVYDDFLLRLAGGLEGAYRHGGARSFVFTPVSVGLSASGLLPQLCAKLQQIGFGAACIAAEELLSAGGRRADAASGQRALPHRFPIRDGAAVTRLERFLQDHDLLLIQAPPLLGSALTEYAVRCADATILLVESMQSHRPELRRAAALLERLNSHGIGAVLENVRLRFADPGFRDSVRAADNSPHQVPTLGEAARAAREDATEQEQEPSVAPGGSIGNAPDVVADEQSDIVADQPETSEAVEYAVPAELEPHEPEELTEYSANEFEDRVIEPMSQRSAAAHRSPVEPAPVRFETGTIFFTEGDPTAGTAGTVEAPEEVLASGAHDSNTTSLDAPAKTFLKFAEDTPAWISEPLPVADEVTVTPEFPASEAMESESEPVRGWAAWKHVDDEELPAVPSSTSWLAATDHETEDEHVEEKSFPLLDAEDSLEEDSSPEEIVTAPTLPTVPTLPIDEEISAPPPHPLREVFATQSSSPAADAAPGDDGKPVSWWRRLLQRTKEPSSSSAVPIADAEHSELTNMEPVSVGLTAEDSSSEEDIAPAAVSVAEPLSQSSLEDQAEAFGFDDVESFLDARRRAAMSPAESFTPAEEATELEPYPELLVADIDSSVPVVIAVEEPEHDAMEMADSTSLGPSSRASLFTDAYYPLSSADTHAFGTREQEREQILAPGFPNEEDLMPAASANDGPDSPGALLEHDLPAALPPAARPQRSSDSADHVAVDPKGPLGTFPRPRTSPVTLDVPSMRASASPTRREEEVRGHIAKSDAAKSRLSSAYDAASSRPASSSNFSQRSGWAKAMAQSSSEDGPPARASEGMTAMRTGAGLRKAMVRGEAARAQAQSTETLHRQEQPGMSRRWAMLSQFERGGRGAASVEQDAAATPQEGFGEPGSSRV